MLIKEYGDKTGKAVLCVPGVFMAAECFRRLAEELPEYRMVCVTLDGFHPDSDEFESLEQQTEKLVRMLQDRGTTQFELVIGLSMGTIFAVRLAKHPSLHIKKLLLDGAVNFYRSKYKPIVHAAIYLIFSHFMKTSGDKDQSIRDLGKVYGGDWPEIQYVCRTSLTKPSLRVIAKLLADYKLEPGVTQPMYLLYGGDEDNVQTNSKVVKDLYPDAKIAVKPGYNHLAFLNREPMFDLICNSMFRQFGQKFYLLIQQRPHTVGHMLLMGSVDGHTFLAVAVVATGFLTGTVILVPVFLAELCSELFLEPEPLLAVPLVKFFHCSKFFLISFNDHSHFLPHK